MISRLAPAFRKDFARLPANVQQRARQAYRQFQSDPTHPSLHFKPLQARTAAWSIRISNSYRAVGLRHQGDEIIWIFIGSHTEYERFLKTL